MGSISYNGGDYEFIDPESKGYMNLDLALEAGFPRGLFRELDVDGTAIVTPAQFKAFQREQMRDALKQAMADST